MVLTGAVGGVACGDGCDVGIGECGVAAHVVVIADVIGVIVFGVIVVGSHDVDDVVMCCDMCCVMLVLTCACMSCVLLYVALLLVMVMYAGAVV